VTGPDRYDPEINATYADMAEHYGMAVVPARPRKPRDKSKVEAAVLIVQRWIVACLRNHRFETLEQRNQAVADLLEQLNDRPFRNMYGARISLLELRENVGRPAMRPLPVYRYELAIRKNATVNIDYHVAYDDRLYSVPYALVQAKARNSRHDHAGGGSLPGTKSRIPCPKLRAKRQLLDPRRASSTKS
jgi:hypothetical protein